MSSDKKSKRKQAFDIFKEHKGYIDLVEIARLLDSPPGTVRGWKSKDRWEDKLTGTFQEKKRSVPKEKAERSKVRGAPKGNQNAIGNTGGAAKPNNKNAVKTGEFESIIENFMTDEEKDYYQNIGTDPFFVLQDEIRMLRFRQTRMFRRILEAEKGLSGKEIQTLKELRGRKEIIETKGRKVTVQKEPNLLITETREKTTRKIDDILRIEDALTRVSTQLQKSIKQLNELTLNEQRLELIKEQTRKVIAETNEISGSTTNNEVDDWKKAVINAANKRVYVEAEKSAVIENE